MAQNRKKSGKKPETKKTKKPSRIASAGVARVHVFRLSEYQEARVAKIIGVGGRADAPDFFAALDFAVIGLSGQEAIDQGNLVHDLRACLRDLLATCEDLSAKLSALRGHGQALHLLFEELPGGGDAYEECQSMLGELEMGARSAFARSMSYKEKQGSPARIMLACCVRDAMRAHTSHRPTTTFPNGKFAQILQILLYPNETESTHDIRHILREALKGT